MERQKVLYKSRPVLDEWVSEKAQEKKKGGMMTSKKSTGSSEEAT